MTINDGVVALGGDPDAILIPMAKVLKLTSLSRTRVNCLRKVGKFPQVVPLSDRRFAFIQAEVLAWIQDRIAARETNDRAAMADRLNRARDARRPREKKTA